MESNIRVKPSKWVELQGSVTLMDTERLENPDTSLEGNQLRSIPKAMGSAGVEVDSPLGLGGRIKYKHMGKYYTTDDNSNTYGGYDLLDIGLLYKVFGNSSTMTLRFDVKNVLNEHYASMASDDWGLYSPGMPRSYWVSIHNKW
jgi:outer membrane receptor protein involved in Fe transport